jgi:DNA-binding NarL/FixJ family response regulator
MWPEEKSLRVVIADDDEAYAELVADLLTRCRELEVVGIAKDGEEAVQLACWQDADVVLMDVDMPRIDGITATRLVRKARPRVCVLMLSGAEPDRIHDAREAGAAAYINKANAQADLVPTLLALAATPVTHPS